MTTSRNDYAEPVPLSGSRLIEASAARMGRIAQVADRLRRLPPAAFAVAVDQCEAILSGAERLAEPLAGAQLPFRRPPASSDR